MEIGGKKFNLVFEYSVSMSSCTLQKFEVVHIYGTICKYNIKCKFINLCLMPIDDNGELRVIHKRCPPSA